MHPFFARIAFALVVLPHSSRPQPISGPSSVPAVTTLSRSQPPIAPHGTPRTTLCHGAQTIVHHTSVRWHAWLSEVLPCLLLPCHVMTIMSCSEHASPIP